MANLLSTETVSARFLQEVLANEFPRLPINQPFACEAGFFKTELPEHVFPAFPTLRRCGGVLFKELYARVPSMLLVAATQRVN